MLQNDLRAIIAEKKGVIVVGTGVSAAMTNNHPHAGWVGLLSDGLARAKGLVSVDGDIADLYAQKLSKPDVKLEVLLQAASLIEQGLVAPHGGEFGRWLSETVGALQPMTTSLAQAIAGLDLPLLTTNYDGLLELGRPGAAAVTWRQVDRATLVLQGKSDDVLHLHGHWKDAKSVVLGNVSYHDVVDDPFSTVLKQAIATLGSMVFVGCGVNGLADPDFARFLKWFETIMGETHHRHFILCRESESQRPQGRLHWLPYGKDYADLEPFLRALAAPAAPAPTPVIVPPVAIVDPAAPARSVVLPRRPESVRGRDTMINQLVALMTDDGGAAAVWGGPGMGKSTLCLCALHSDVIQARFGGRRWFARLDAVTEAEGLWPRIGAAIGLTPEQSNRAVVLHVLASDGAGVLVLDNLEEAWHADRPGLLQALAWLAEIRGLRVVIAIRGTCDPALVPRARCIDLHRLDPTDAREVFLDRAGEKFRGDAMLESLVGAMDGHPLSLHLMGTLAGLEPGLKTLFDRWQAKKSDLLREGDQRDSNLAICIDLSVHSPAMTGRGRDLLSLMGLLPDGIADGDLTAILPPDGDDVGRLLVRLGMAHWGENDRLRQLAPIREHLRAHLQPRQDILGPCLEFYLRIADLGERMGKDGGPDAVVRIAPQTGNLIAMIDLALTLTPIPSACWDAAWGLAEYGRFYRTEGIQAIVGRCAERAPNRGVQAELFKQLGLLAGASHDYRTARHHLEKARDLHTRTGSRNGQASCLLQLGTLHLWKGELKEARRLLLQAKTLSAKSGVPGSTLIAEEALGSVAMRSDDLRSAERSLSAIVKSAAPPLTKASAYAGLASLALQQGEFHTVEVLVAEGSVQATLSGDPTSMSTSQDILGELASIRGAFDAADSHFGIAFTYDAKAGDPVNMGVALQLRAANRLDQGRPDLARPLIDQAIDLLTRARVPNRLLDAKALSARVMVQEGNTALAIREFTAILANDKIPVLSDTLAACHWGLGDAAWAEGRGNDAAKAWRKALEIEIKRQNRIMAARLQARLARVTEGAERQSLAAAARATFTELGLTHRLAEMDGDLMPA